MRILLVMTLSLPVLASPLSSSRVSWQPLHSKDGIFSSHLSITPWTSYPSITIEKQARTTVLLDRNSALYIEFIDHDDERYRGQPLQLEALIFASPGLAEKVTLTPSQAVLPSASHDRIVKLYNRNEHAIAIRAYQSLEQDLQSFAPLTWLHTEGDNGINISDNRDQHHSFNTAPDEDGFDLSTAGVYWLESASPLTAHWPRNHSDVWSIQEDRVGSLRQHLEFDPANPGRVILPVQHDGSMRKHLVFSESEPGRIKFSSEQYFATMRPLVFRLMDDRPVHVKSSGANYGRVQKVDEDWLFDRNYETYSHPSIEQLLELSDFSQHQLLSTTALTAINSAERATTLTADENVKQLNKTLFNSLSRWTKTRALKPQLASTAAVKFVNPEPISYDFQENEADMHFSPIALSSVSSQVPYFRIQAGETLYYSRPVDSVSNLVTVQVAATTDTSLSGSFRVMVDGREFTEFILTEDNDYQQFSRSSLWTMVQNRMETSRIFRHNLYLPDHWQELAITVTNGEIPVNVNYDALDYPKLDEAHWQAWLHNAQQTETTDSFFSHLMSHPHWQHFHHYLYLKAQQYNAAEYNPAIRRLILGNQAVSGLFDRHIPKNLPEHQLLQKLLQHPESSEIRYWQQLVKTLRQIGWDGYALNLLKQVISLHDSQTIRESAISQTLDILHQKQNDAEKVNLLAFVYLFAEISPAFKMEVAQQLAESLYNLDKPDFSLFVLLPQHKPQKNSTLIQRAVTKMGFKTISETLPRQRIKTASGNAQAGQVLPDMLQSGEIIDLYNVDLGVNQKNYLVSTNKLSMIHTDGPAILDFTVRQWLPESREEHDWLEISFAGKSHLLPVFASSFHSDTLRHPDARVGPAHRFVMHIPDAGTVKLRASKQALLVNYREQSRQYDVSLKTSECYRDDTQRVTMDIAAVIKDDDQFSCFYPDHSVEAPSAFHIEMSGLQDSQSYPESLLTRLHRFEQTANQQTLVELNAELETWPPSALKQRLLRRLNDQTEWLIQNSPMKAKKFIFKEFSTNVPLGPDGIRSRLLYSPQNRIAERLSSNSVLNYELEVRENEDLRLELLSQQHLFVREQTALLGITVDDNKEHVLSLKTGESSLYPLQLQSGKHTLRLRLLDNNSIASVLASLQFQTEKSGNWQEQPQTIRLKLFQADEQTPYQLYVPEISWLRIDTFDETGLIDSEYVMADEGIFSWTGSAQSDHAFRVAKLQIADASTVAATTQPARQKAYPPLQPTGERYSYLPEAPGLPTADNTAGHTWGIELSQQQRRSPFEDGAQTNRLNEIAFYSGKTDIQQRYFINQAFSVRMYEQGFSESFHGSYNWWDTQWRKDMNFNAGLSVAAQESEQSGKWAWSSRINATFDWNSSWNRRWFNRISLDTFARLMPSNKDVNDYATAVYSRYKLDHTHGASLSDRLRFKINHDAELWGQFNINSNALFEEFSVDNLVAQIGARLYYQGLTADINWRYQRFLHDDNRAVSSGDSRLGVSVDWFAWHSSSHFRVRAGVDRNLFDNENYWYIRLIYNNDNGRGVRDYQPQSLSFSRLRHQQFIQTDAEQSRRGE